MVKATRAAFLREGAAVCGVRMEWELFEAMVGGKALCLSAAVSESERRRSSMYTSQTQKRGVRWLAAGAS